AQRAQTELTRRKAKDGSPKAKKRERPHGHAPLGLDGRLQGSTDGALPALSGTQAAASAVQQLRLLRWPRGRVHRRGSLIRRCGSRSTPWAAITRPPPSWTERWPRPARAPRSLWSWTRAACARRSSI